MARVLIVEPDDVTRIFIAGILSDFGHDVEQCAALHEAERQLSAVAFDVVATDLALGANFPANLLAITNLSGEPHAAADRALSLRDRPFRFADLLRLVDFVALYGPSTRAAAA